MKKSVQIEVSAGVYDVLGAVAKAVGDIKASIKAGGPAEVPMIVSALVADLVPVLSEIAALPAEVLADKVGSLEAVMIQAPALVQAILG